MREVTVIIPNYNGKEYLLSCLGTLYKNTKIDMDVIVVDNGSEDGSVDAASAIYPQVRYIILKKNYGFCKAVNEGIKNANTPYVILLNNDTEIRRGFAENLLSCIKRNKKIFSVEAKMLQYINPELIDSAGSYYCALGWAFAEGKDRQKDKYNKRKRCFASCAGAAIYRKSVFDEIGLFDENHFAYLEDIDIGYRARIYGYENVYEPNAEVLHVGSAASGSRYNEFKTRYSARNNIYMIYKNMPYIQVIVNFPFLIAGFAVKTLFFYKKGLGNEYIKALWEGINMCRSSKKVPCSKDNLKNYVKIQIELWINVIRRFL